MIVDDFIKYLKFELNYSDHTVCAYGNDLNQFADFLCHDGENPRFEEVEPADIRAWTMQRSQAGDSASSIRRKTQALRAFYKYLMRQGVVEVSPAADVELVKLKKRLPSFIREENLENLLTGEIDESDFEQVRNRLMVAMFYETGMRRAELIGLLDRNVACDVKEIKVRGKRDKDRIVPFGDDLKKAIIQYRSLRAKVVGSTEYFFTRLNGEKLYPSLVYNVVTQQLREAGGGNKFNPHVLRHTFASAMLNHGAEINSVKELLGHESLAATQAYTHVTFRELKNNYQLAHPRAYKKGGQYGSED